LLGDGRPFSKEEGAQAARSQPLPLPGTVAGFLRTRYGHAQPEWSWTPEEQARTLELSVAGPFLLRNGCPVLPAPADAVILGTEQERAPKGDNKPRVMPLRPMRPPDGWGCDLPDGMLPLGITEEGKPAKGYRYWTAGELFAWLRDAPGANTPAPKNLAELESESRVHVAMDPATGRGVDSLLFSVRYRIFERYRFEKASDKTETRIEEKWTLAARWEAEVPEGMQGVGTLGGERRLTAVSVREKLDWPSGASGGSAAPRLRMYLATPALFSGGWKPGWLDAETNEGSPPGLAGTRLKLVAAAVPRRQAVSGWDYAKGGPKAARWMVPAGAVYFFERLEGDACPTDFASVCDAEQDRRDGYGAALWGIWDYAKEEEGQ
jgi:CRISPR-associated protein Cmr3